MYICSASSRAKKNVELVAGDNLALVTHDIAWRKDTSPEKEEVYEKASDAETAAETGAGDTEDEADDVETKELRRNGAAEAPNRPAACLRGRRRPPRAADGEGRSEGSAARRESMRQVEAEAKASMGGGERASGGMWCRRGWRCRSALKRITFVFCCRFGFAVEGRKRWA